MCGWRPGKNFLTDDIGRARWSLKCGRVVDQGSRRVTHLLRLLRRAPREYRAALGLNIHPGLFTSTLLNCQGSSRSRFSGNNRPRSASGVQSVYRPITGPRYGRWTPSRRHRKMLSVPTALNNSSEYLPNSGGQSHCQCPPERHPNRRAKNICPARSCSDCTQKRKKA